MSNSKTNNLSTEGVVLLMLYKRFLSFSEHLFYLFHFEQYPKVPQFINHLDFNVFKIQIMECLVGDPFSRLLRQAEHTSGLFFL